MGDPAPFDPAAKRVFGLPMGCDFSECFLDGLFDRLGPIAPEDLARVQIFTNTRRAARRWADILHRRPALLMPQIRVFTELASDPVLSPVSPDEDRPLAHRFTVMRAVRALLTSGHSLAPASASFELAGSLVALLGEMVGEGVDPAALEGLDVEGHSDHWQTALSFLRIIHDSTLAEGAVPLTADARQRIAVEALAALWQANPPAHPVIVAGSTGSRGTTALLMKAVLSLPQGAIVLPGFDFDLNPRSWDALETAADPTDDHPQAGFARLGGVLGFGHADVEVWRDATPENTARNRLVSLALRPAPVTHEWLSEGPALEAEIGPATGNLSLIEAPNERMEAAAISVVLRQALEDGRTAALVTPDATLSRRVTASLGRWGIIPDDSAGVPLRLSPPAIFMDLVLQSLDDQVDTTAFAAVMNHPICASGWDRGGHLRLMRALDAELLRDIGSFVNWERLRDWAASSATRRPEAVGWIAWIEAVYAAAPEGDMSPDGFLGAHRAAAERLAAGPEGEDSSELWAKDAGAAMTGILDGLDRDGSAAGPVSRSEYVSIFRALLRDETLREEGFLPDSRVAIWGQLEARVQSADVVVLGGLNEGVWPAMPNPDPWLNRSMRSALGLPVPERRVGLAAHDFQQAMTNNRVVLSRATKQDNTPSVASRWLIRFENLLGGISGTGVAAFADIRTRGSVYLETARKLDRPERRVAAEPRPAPAPPRDARPTEITVTEVERLIRDPYAIYARRVLGLKPLTVVGRLPDARDRGTSFHSILEEFVDATRDGLPTDAVQLLERISAGVLERLVPWPAQQRLWHARIMRIAQNFVASEQERRAFATPHLLEVKGSVDLAEVGRPYRLVGKADRIDLTPDGEVAIYDYKSSLSQKQEREFSKQIELEANMAMRDGFQGLGVRRAALLQLIGLNNPDETADMPHSPDKLAEIWREFLILIAYFEDQGHGYPARLRAQNNVTRGDYDQLARRGEWEDNAGFEDELLW